MVRPTPWLRMCLLILPGLTVLQGSGCSQVRLIRNAPDGGIVSIPNNSNQWPTYYRNRAEFLMHRNCPEGYVIVSERLEEDNPAAEDGRKPNEDFDYNGGYERVRNYRRQAYHIMFRRQIEDAPVDGEGPKTLPHRPAASPPAPAEKGTNDLPPPRRLPPGA